MSVLKPRPRAVLYVLARYWRTWKPRKLQPASPSTLSSVWAMRVSDDLRLPMELTAGLCQVASRPGWEVRAHELFEAVQRDVRQQRRRDAPLRGAARRCGEHVVIEHPGPEPRFHKAVQR